MYLYVTQKTDLFSGNRKRMLHIAPEAQLSRLFQEADCIDYLSADLSSATAMVKIDITDFPMQTAHSMSSTVVTSSNMFPTTSEQS
jgi:hypothetical protein